MTDIYVVGYPKAGTTWLCRLLGDALDSPVGAAYRPVNDKAIATEGADRPGQYYIGHGHLEPVHKGADASLITRHNIINLDALNDEKIIVMIRDPRDIIVSAQHHWGMESLDKAIECVLYGLWPMPHGGGIEKFYKEWKGKDIIPISYEMLLEDTALRLRQTLTNLGIPSHGVRTVVERQSFDARKKWTEEHGDELNYGKEFQLRFLRKGIVGDWKNHFNSKQADYVNEELKDFLKVTGYIK